MSEQILVNHVREEMQRQGVSQQKLSRNTGLSRRTIERLYEYPSENFRINTMKKIADALGVAVESLFDYVTDYTVYHPDPNGFSPENLLVLDQCLADTGIQLHYQVYSEQRKMNIETKYAGCRRVSFSGNWMFDYYHEPRLTLVDYDVDYSRINVQVDEIEKFYANIIQATIDYAAQMQISTIEHQIMRSKLLPKGQLVWRRGLNVSVIRDRMLRQQGFVEYNCAQSEVEQLRYRV
jgi:transcriptional regulator with XRE-family HTH domain